MNWGEFKQKVDEKITEELGAGFDESRICIDWIDISNWSTVDINIHKHDDDYITIQVTD